MKILHDLKVKFDIFDAKAIRDDLLLFSVEKEILIPLLLYLKEQHSYRTLIMISTVDWIEDEKFQLSYILWNPYINHNIIVRTFIQRKKPEFETISNIWPQAEVFERELKELYGINFKGNKRVDENFILEDWDNIPPMRRDFDSRDYSLKKFGKRFKKNEVIIRKEISEQYDEWRRK